MYAGIYSKYYVQMQRVTPNSVNVTVEPSPEDMGDFQNQFLDEYLNRKVKVADLYKLWSKKDPKYFAKIADPLLGMRCLR